MASTVTLREQISPQAEQVRVNPNVKRILDWRRRPSESDDDVLERRLAETTAADFHDGFWIPSEEADWDSGTTRGDSGEAEGRVRQVGEDK